LSGHTPDKTDQPPESNLAVCSEWKKREKAQRIQKERAEKKVSRRGLTLFACSTTSVSNGCFLTPRMSHPDDRLGNESESLVV
jgi:hypothetical protein